MKFFLHFIILLTFVSCGKKKSSTQSGMIDENSITITIPANIPSDSKIFLSEFVDSVEYIRLETTTEAILSNVSGVFFCDDIIIVSEKQTQCIYLFDRQGKYISKIDKRGKGPGEYIQISQMMFDRDKQMIIVYDSMQSKMLFYSLSGKLIKEVLNFSERVVIQNIKNLPDGRFLCYSCDFTTGSKEILKYIDPKFISMWLVDQNGKFERNLLQYDKVYPYFLGTEHFQLLCDGKVNFSDKYTSDIYQFYDDGLHGYIHYDIKGPKATDFEGMSHDPQKDIYHEYFHAGFIEEKGDYIFSVWSGNETLFYSLFDKKDNRFKIASGLDSGNLGEFSSQWIFISSNIDNAFVQKLDQNLIDMYMRYGGTSELDLVKKELGVDEDELIQINPILKLWHVKK